MNEENNKENNKEVFQCICGKYFNTKKQFSGHKGGCKIYRESIKDRTLKEQQEKESRRLPNGMFKCEECGKEHDGSYGSGRFCSDHCRRVYSGKHVNINGNQKCNFKIGKSKNKCAPYGTWKCKFCDQIFKTRKLLKQHEITMHRPKYGPHGKGKPIWNKGLTKETSDIIRKSALKYSINNKGKPGYPHTKETREKLSKARSKILDSAHAGFQDVGWYKVKNLNAIEYTVRGHWEENVALKLNSLGILWEKNKWLSYFDGEITRHYNPDFYIPNQNLYIEVKGYFSDKDKLKMKLVLEQNAVKLYFIGSDKYQKFIDGQISFDDNLLYRIS